MTPNDLRELIPQPMAPCVPVWVRPNKSVEISLVVLEERKKILTEFCRDLPETITGWKDLLPFVGNDKELAFILLAVGDLLRVWSVHPPVDRPELWIKGRHIYPHILRLQMPKVASRVPKPSAGDLEKDLITCVHCHTQMGPYGSAVHDFTEFMPGHGCVSMDPETCPEREKQEKVATVIGDAAEAPDTSFIDDYLSQFEG